MAQQARLTLVVYMGVSGAAQIQHGLLGGLPGHTPVAIVQHASLPQERHVVTTLERMHEALSESGMASPAVIVVGDVIRGMASVASQPGELRALHG